MVEPKGRLTRTELSNIFSDFIDTTAQLITQSEIFTPTVYAVFTKKKGKPDLQLVALPEFVLDAAFENGDAHPAAQWLEMGNPSRTYSLEMVMSSLVAYQQLPGGKEAPPVVLFSALDNVGASVFDFYQGLVDNAGNRSFVRDESQENGNTWQHKAKKDSKHPTNEFLDGLLKEYALVTSLDNILPRH